MKSWGFRALTAGASAVILAGFAVGAARGEVILALFALLSAGAATMAWVVQRFHPHSAVAPALAWSSGSVVLVLINDLVAASTTTASPLPGASLAAHWWVGDWPVNLAGVFALLLVFPDTHGRTKRMTRMARSLPWCFVAGTVCVVAGMWNVPQSDGRVATEPEPGLLPLTITGLLLVAASLFLAVLDLAHRYRRGDAAHRQRIRWLMLAGVAVFSLLCLGWAMQIADLPLAVSYLPFLTAIEILIPAAVTIAVIRHDLFDVDQLLGSSLSWLLSLLISAGAFALLAVGIGVVIPSASDFGPMVAAFVAALVLLPLHRSIRESVERLIDRERFEARSRAERFVTEVRAGTRNPEEVETVLRTAVGDPGLRILVLDRDADGWHLTDGTPTQPSLDAAHLDVRRGIEVLARIEFERTTTRVRHLAAELARVVALPLELCRLEIAAQRSADEAKAAGARLAQFSALERRKLERDLHDGVQQRLVGTGLRLRTLQPTLDGEAAAEVDRVVADLRETIEELRRVAHGIRPSRLDDGLAAALHSLRMDKPTPVHVEVGDLPELSEAEATTAFFVVAEAVTNALKHGKPSQVNVKVQHESGALSLTVADDGIGPGEGIAVTSLADRLTSLGGSIAVAATAEHPPSAGPGQDPRPGPGPGTTVTAVIPCAY